MLIRRVTPRIDNVRGDGARTSPRVASLRQRQQFPRTQAEALAWSGVTWDYGIGDFTAAGATALWGGVGLPNVTATVTAVGTPFPGQKAGETDDVGGRWRAVNNTVFQLGSNPFAILTILEIVAVSDAGDRLFGKFGGGVGWQVQPTVLGNLIANANDGTTSASATLTSDHRGIGAFPLFMRGIPGGLLTLRSTLGVATVAMGSLTLDNIGIFAYPAWNGFSPLVRVYNYLTSIGANALGIDDAAMFDQIWKGP